MNSESSTAAVVDLENGVVLQPSVSGFGTLPQAVAVDAVLNEALVVNQGSGTVSILSLGNTFRNLQIAEASPDVTFAPAAANSTLTINGIGFVQGTSQVFLDRTALPGGKRRGHEWRAGRLLLRFLRTCSRSRGVTSLPSKTRRTNVSNATDLAVVQPVVVGNSPSSVAVDPDTDIAAVTNSCRQHCFAD